MESLPDVQNRIDKREIKLEKVGVTNLFHPLTIRDKINQTQTVTAEFAIFVGLHPDQRGAHLSHLIDGLHKYKTALFSMDDLLALVKDVRAKQDREGMPFEDAYISIGFKYFIEKAAPSSGIESLLGYDCGFEVALNKPGFKAVTVRVPVSTVCPCSMEISIQGAHNQRAEVTIQVLQNLADPRIIWIEDLVRIAEKSASGDLFTVLRRADEKFVTEKMFSSPAFVEDVVRTVVQHLKSEVGQVRYTVKCETFESIHPHNAYAEVSGECQ